MKPKHQRLWFVVASVAFLSIGSVLVLRALSDNLVYFVTPSDLRTKVEANEGKRVRVGGLVTQGTMVYGPDGDVFFHITDGKAAVQVQYEGVLPSLFREGQGVVAEGRLQIAIGMPPIFIAERVLTKHDENYMPKEVVEALKASGRWQEGKGAPSP
jgi:cytochrome c-type biogenesis protein CcmE